MRLQVKEHGMCPVTCGTSLPCGHDCQGSCSACCKVRLRTGIVSEAKNLAAQHVPCRQPCRNVLVCGHPCSDRCHPPEEPCSRCKRECSTKCAHKACDKDCNQVRQTGFSPEPKDYVCVQSCKSGVLSTFLNKSLASSKPADLKD